MLAKLSSESRRQRRRRTFLIGNHKLLLDRNERNRFD